MSFRAILNVGPKDPRPDLTFANIEDSQSGLGSFGTQFYCSEQSGILSGVSFFEICSSFDCGGKMEKLQLRWKKSRTNKTQTDL